MNQVSAFGILSCWALCSALPAYAQPQISPYAIIQPTDAVAGNEFGRSPVIHDGKLYVGAVGVQNGANAGTGGVYVFDLQTLTQENYITATTSTPDLPPEQFGQSIAVQDGRLLVGSREDDSESTVKAGAAYLFEYPSGTQLARYTQEYGHINMHSMFFGLSVALIGDLAVVTDPTGQWHNRSGGGVLGTVNFYDIPTGQQVARVDARDSGYYQFGNALAVWNDKLVVAFKRGDSVYIYDPTTRERISEIFPPVDPFYFGNGMAVHGNTLVASDSAAFYNEFLPTAIYMIDLVTHDLIRTITITPDTGDIGLGAHVAINDRYLLATRRHVVNQVQTRVLVFDVTTGDQIGELLALSDESRNGFVRGGMVLDGDVAYISNSESDELPNPGGAMLVYDLSQLGTTCLADTNGDGVLTPADFSAWVAAFNKQAPACDQNGDGACSPADFSAWVANYNAGC